MSVPTTTNQGVIEVDPNERSDGDSTFSDQSTTTTTSLASSILKHREENGRRYHAFREGKYMIPNDDIENDRLDLQHALFNLTVGGKLHLAPVTQAQDVLDIGTGTGIWAIDYADEHPSTNVLAVDLSPIQPAIIPPNLTFLIDDIEDRWTYDRAFDFIHARQLTGSIQAWDALMQQAFSHLKPGGWLEIQDTMTLGCDDDTLKQATWLLRWQEVTCDAFERMGRTLRAAAGHKQRLLDAGFVDVHEVVYKWPINTWPKDARMKEIGLWSRENIVQGLEALPLAVLTRNMGWRPEEVKVLAAKAREDLFDRRIHAYWPVYFVYGRKPEM